MSPPAMAQFSDAEKSKVCDDYFSTFQEYILTLQVLQEPQKQARKQLAIIAQRIPVGSAKEKVYRLSSPCE